VGRTIDEVIASLPEDEQRKIEARAAELIAEEMTLRELRKAMGRTQAEVAKLTGKPQATISRMEAQSDMLLSNLDRVVGAMGGRVRVMAELPGRPPVFLTGFGDLAPTEQPKPPRKPRAKRAEPLP
jgi:transcriptional regulator with XRE-family HTH domain